MSICTKEQETYIMYDKITDTKLIACAGGGKTFCIISRMNYLIESKKLNNNEILMLTFSRFTRDDFINKIKKYNVTTINDNYIKTIDSFAKSIIDTDNEIDVSLLSYKFMKYLQYVNPNELEKNDKIIVYI